jgi:hypothetical protein
MSRQTGDTHGGTGNGGMRYVYLGGAIIAAFSFAAFWRAWRNRRPPFEGRLFITDGAGIVHIVSASLPPLTRSTPEIIRTLWQSRRMAIACL